MAFLSNNKTLFTRGILQPNCSGLIDRDNVIFYHPFDTNVEYTKNQSWVGTSGFADSILISGLAPNFRTPTFFGETEFKATNGPFFISSTKISPSSIVVVYTDGFASDAAKAKVGIVTSSGVNFGSEVTIDTGGINGCYYLGVDVLEDNKFIVVYRKDITSGNLDGLAKIGTVTGTTISLGSAFKFEDTNASWDDVSTIDSTHAMIIFRNDSSNGFGLVSTITGSTISFGSNHQFSSGNANKFLRLNNLSSSKAVLSFVNASNSGICKIASISGTTITYGSEYTFNSTSTDQVFAYTIDSNNFIIVYRDVTNSKSYVRAGSVSGTVITFGTAQQFANNARGLSVCINDNQYLSIAYQDISNSNNGKSILGRVSGTDILLGQQQRYTTSVGETDAADVANTIIPFSSGISGQPIILYRDGSDSNHGTSRIVFPDSFSSISGTSYPSVLDSTRLVYGFWCHNPSSGNNIVKIQKGYSLILDNSNISLSGSSQISWPIISSINDNNDHYCIFDFEYINNNSWNLKTSIDGDNFSNLGSISGLPLIVTDTNPKVDMISQVGDVSQSWIDEVVLWKNNNIFTSGELTQLYSLANNYSEPMNSYMEFFSECSGVNTGSIDFFCHGFSIISSGINFYTQGDSTQFNQIDLFLNGYDIFTNSIDLFLRNPSFEDNDLIIFIHGFDTLNNSIDLFLFGNDFIESDISLYIDGIGSFNKDIDLFLKCPIIQQINFFISGLSSPVNISCPTLDSTASIQIGDDLIQIYQSRIDALINQLGKNVLLKFDPLTENCPNCKYDSISKRSSGIHKQGGPIQFSRGQKCPYCKGDGIIYYEVTKCIKCLVKWNPKDLLNYGISVQKSKSIVRLKAFLTDIDDIIRAKTALIDYDINGQFSQIVYKIKGPVPIGLRQDRYCLSFWGLLDT